MKFDKVMEIAYKILAVFTCLALVGGVVSCSKSYIKASAVEITVEEQAGINDYLQAYSEQQAAIDFRLDTNADGSRSTRLQIYGLQQLAYFEQFGIYDNMDFAVAPDSVNVTVSGGAGLCKYNDRFYPVTLYNGGSVLAQSDIFKIYIGTDVVNSGIYFRPPNAYPANCYGTRLVNPNSVQCSIRGTGIMSGGSGLFSGNVYVKSSTTGIPIMSGSENVSSYAPYDGSIPSRNVCGLAQAVNLPITSVDTKKPWDYYNNTVLPYLEENYPDYRDYFVFPDGYQPQQDPTEPPSIEPNRPGGGVPIIAPIIVGSGNIINVDGIDFHIYAPIKGQLEIDGITFQFPGDGSNDVYIDRSPYKIPLPEFEYKNHTIEIPDISHIIFDGVTFNINPDGSLTINNDNYPLPIGQPETVSSNDDYLVYKYEIPTVENINIVDAELSAPDLTGFADSIAFISGATMDTLEQLGLVPFVLAMLSIGVFGVCLWKLGG